MDFIDMATICAPSVHPQTMQALVKVESGFNPFAIGVVGGSLERQPRNLAEALATAKELERLGFNYSVGYAQVNKHNFKKYGLTTELALNACESLRAGSEILSACFKTAKSAKGRFPTQQDALMGAFSCYYSGNLQTGFKPDFKGQPSYVQKVINAATGGKVPPAPIGVVKNNPVATARPVPSQAGQPQASSAQTRSAMVF